MQRGSEHMECPECARPAVLHARRRRVQGLGEVETTLLKCAACGLALADAVLDGEERPRAFSLVVEEPRDLDTVLVKSSTGTVKIPFLGVRVGPAEGAQGMVTTLAGFLRAIKAEAEKVARQKPLPDKDPLDQQALARAEVQRLKRALAVAEPFEVIVEDPYGNSALAGPRVRENTLSEEDRRRLDAQIQQMEL